MELTAMQKASAKRIAQRHRDREATSPVQWEMADEVLTQGLKHPLFRKYHHAIASFEKAMVVAKKQNEGHKRGPVGRTVAPDLLGSCMPELEDVAETASSLAKGIPSALERNVTRWASQ